MNKKHTTLPDTTGQAMPQSIRPQVIPAMFWYAALACYVIVLTFLSLNPWFRPEDRGGALSPDKVEHALAYGALAIMTFLCLVKARHGAGHGTTRVWITALSFAVVFGILMEIAQSLLTTNRTGSVEDAVANTIGAALGFATYQTAKYVRAKIMRHHGSDKGMAQRTE